MLAPIVSDESTAELSTVDHVYKATLSLCIAGPKDSSLLKFVPFIEIEYTQISNITRRRNMLALFTFSFSPFLFVPHEIVVSAT